VTPRYVVGFLLNSNRTRVVLVRKNRPAWQAGRLNGVGGKVELDERVNDAMVREFYEETGCLTETGNWERICSMTWPEPWPDMDATAKAPSIDFFRYVWFDDTPPERLVRTNTDEDIVAVDVADLGFYHVIPNLRWLVPLAAYTADRYEPFMVRATVAETIHPASTT
jgi:8-oxo-dGTP pyrophosphatase MutT (NUDIX family)